MATYYCRADGTAANKAAAIGPETSAAACMTLTVMAAQTFSAGDVILVSGLGGSYAERLLAPSSGTSGNPIIYRGSNFPVVNGNGTHTLRASAKSYVTVEGIIFDGKFAYLSGTSNFIINKCVVTGSTHATLGGFYIDTAGSVTINNSIFHGNTLYGIFGVAGTAITLRNSMIYGNGDRGIYTENTCALDYDYNLITGNNSTLALNMTIGTGATDGGHNIVNYAPGIRSYENNTAYFVFTMDDNADSAAGAGQNGAQLLIIESALAKYKVPMTLFIRTDNTGLGPSATLISNLQALQSRGHEIAVHTWSHTNMTVTTAFTVTSTNADPTCDVDVATTTITLATTTPGNTVTFDYSGNKTIADLVTATTGKGWTITKSTNVQDYLLLSSLADSAGAQAVPYTTNMDRSAPDYMFFYNEIKYPKELLDAQLVTPTETYAYPQGSSDAGAQAYIIAEGLYSAARADTDRSLSSLNIYDIITSNFVSLKGDGTEATIRRLANHYYTWGKNLGYIFAFLVHYTNEFSEEQCQWFVDEIQKLGGEWITFKDAVARIKTDHSTADNITYTKTYADLSNYRLIADSQAIDAGTTVTGITTDFYGGSVPVGAPDIGINEYSDTHVWGTGRLETATGGTRVIRPS